MFDCLFIHVLKYNLFGKTLLKLPINRRKFPRFFFVGHMKRSTNKPSNIDNRQKKRKLPLLESTTSTEEAKQGTTPSKNGSSESARQLRLERLKNLTPKKPRIPGFIRKHANVFFENELQYSVFNYKPLLLRALPKKSAQFRKQVILGMMAEFIRHIERTPSNVRRDDWAVTLMFKLCEGGMRMLVKAILQSFRNAVNEGKLKMNMEATYKRLIKAGEVLVSHVKARDRQDVY